MFIIIIIIIIILTLFKSTTTMTAPPTTTSLAPSLLLATTTSVKTLGNDQGPTPVKIAQTAPTILHPQAPHFVNPPGSDQRTATPMKKAQMMVYRCLGRRFFFHFINM